MSDSLGPQELAKIKQVMNNLEHFHAPEPPAVEQPAASQQQYDSPPPAPQSTEDPAEPVAPARPPLAPEVESQPGNDAPAAPSPPLAPDNSPALDANEHISPTPSANNDSQVADGGPFNPLPDSDIPGNSSLPNSADGPLDSSPEPIVDSATDPLAAPAQQPIANVLSQPTPLSDQGPSSIPAAADIDSGSPVVEPPAPSPDHAGGSDPDPLVAPAGQPAADTGGPFADPAATSEPALADPAPESPFQAENNPPVAAGGPFASSPEPGIPAVSDPLEQPSAETPGAVKDPFAPPSSPGPEALGNPMAGATPTSDGPFSPADPGSEMLNEPDTEVRAAPDSPLTSPSLPGQPLADPNTEVQSAPVIEQPIAAPGSESAQVSDVLESARQAPEEPAASPPAQVSPATQSAHNTPEDILLAIAEAGPSAINTAADTVMTARQEAQQLAPEKTLRKKAASRVKFEALDFDAIVPGHPLVIASYSPSGGVGKSSTAMNLGILIATIAENMAQQKGEGTRVPRVLTLDGDIVMGSLSLRLTSKVEPNLYDLQKYIDQRTAAGFQGPAAWPSSFDSAPPGEEPLYKFTHWPDSPSNFSVLAAPSDPSHFWHFGPDHYRNILNMLGRFYDVIIIDCGTDLVLDSQRAWLSHANEVFLIASPDSDRLYNCAKAARIIASAGPHPQDRRPKDEQKSYPPLATREKLSLVVTRYDSDSGLKLDLLVDKLFPWLEEDQKFWIPDVSQDMTRANNTGRFLVKENQEYAEVINRMAKHAFHRYVSSRSAQNMS